MSESAKNTVIVICFSVLLAIDPLRSIPAFDNATLFVTEAKWGVFFCILTAIIIIMSVSRNERLQMVKWNPVFFSIFFVFGLLIFVAQTFHYVGSGYRIYALLVMFGFPCLYFVWTSRGDHEKLFELLSWAILIVGMIYILSSFALAPFHEGSVIDGSFYGFAGNRNAVGRDGATTLVGALYLSVVLRGRLRYVAYAAMILSLVFVVVSTSRTALLCVLLQIIFYVVIRVKNRKYHRGKNQVRAKTVRRRKFAAAIIIVIIAAVIAAAAILTGIFVKSGDSSQTGIAGIMTQLSHRLFPAGGGDADYYSSGRISIWKQAIDGFNLWGNDVREFSFGAGMFSFHNLPIEFAYRAGLPAGILWLTAEIWVLVWAIRNCVKRAAISDPAIFVSLAISAFLVESMLEVIVLPFTWSLTMIFFFSLAPVYETRCHEVS